tara:strand:+ start:3609 stop:4178 length:570 start_codon:yes stop_codon:yes gene_type:complete
MKSPFYFIVKPKKEKRYNNTVDWEGFEFISNVSKEDFKFSNREAIVVECPNGYTGPIKKGDTLLVHHNVFKYQNDMKGREKNGKSFLRDNTFFLDDSQYYAYRTHESEDWNCLQDYCFVVPVEKKDYYIQKLSKEEPLTGVVKYSNESLTKLGVNKGDMVCFEPHSEYEFTVDGEKMYRMYTRNITMVI